MNRRIGALLVVCLCCWAGHSAVTADEAALLVSEIHNRALVIVMVSKTPDISDNVGYGTGMLLFDYTGEGFWLLTARHVIEGENKNYVFPLLSSDDDDLKRITKRPVPLKDSVGEPRFLHMDFENGGKCDLALLHLSKSEDSIVWYDQPYRPLVKSQLAFEAGVNSGDHVLIFGFADMVKFMFLTARQPLVTDGVVAAETPYQYMIDEYTFKGMSGGLAFKEYIGMVDSTGKMAYGYKPIGLLWGGVPATEGLYSWITKIDFVDSLFQRSTGKKWGE